MKDRKKPTGGVFLMIVFAIYPRKSSGLKDYLQRLAHLIGQTEVPVQRPEIKKYQRLQHSIRRRSMYPCGKIFFPNPDWLAPLGLLAI